MKLQIVAEEKYLKFTGMLQQARLSVLFEVLTLCFKITNIKILITHL